MIVTEKRIQANRRNNQIAKEKGLLKGRPMGSLTVSVQEHKKAITEYLAKYIADNIVPMVEDMRKEVHAGNVMAFVALLDRAYGKVPQGIVASDKDGTPIVFMPPELIAKYALQTTDTVKSVEVTHEMVDVKQEQEVLSDDVKDVSGGGVETLNHP